MMKKSSQSLHLRGTRQFLTRLLEKWLKILYYYQNSQQLLFFSTANEIVVAAQDRI